MSRQFTFRKFEREDLPRISEFRKSFFEYDEGGRSHEPEYYAWKCCQNPVLPGEIWIAEDGNKIVAIKNTTPKRMKVLGTVVNAAEIGDSYTHPDYQRLGISTVLSKAARDSMFSKEVSLIYGLPNKDALLASLRKPVNALVPIKIRSLAKLILPKPILNRKLSPPFLVAMVSPVLEVASKIIFKMATRAVAKSEIMVSSEPTFPDDIDILWQKASKNYDIMLVRNKEYLQWRYVTNPDTYSILIARNRKGAILGYMVTRLDYTNNIPKGFIVDFLTLENDPNIFKKLLATALESFYRKKVSYLSTYAVKGSFYDRILFRTGFLPRQGQPLMCYKNGLGNQVLRGYHKWHFTMGDSDNV
jgi:GNAT superfamily N-acetyltransferase